MVNYPLIIVNLKTYGEGMGLKASKLAKTAERVYDITGVSIAIAPQALDLQAVAENCETPVFAQHIDPVFFGKYTGHILPDSIAESGCIGTLLNHSERPIQLEIIDKSIKRAREVDLHSVISVNTIEKAKEIALFNPDAIAIEPPELIGSGISVSKAQPEIVKGAVEAIKSINPTIKVLCGAGIVNGEDVSAALDLGAEGILVASGVVKSSDPYKTLLDLARAMQSHSSS